MSEDSVQSSVPPPQLQMRRSFGSKSSRSSKSSSVSMVATVSIHDRLAAIDRCVGASSSSSECNNNANNNANHSEWADPLQPVTTTTTASSDSEPMHIDECSNQASLSGSSSNQGSLDIQNQQQQALGGTVEPWHLCPPVANNGHKCPHCSAGYSSKAGLRRHIESKHPETLVGRSSQSSGGSSGHSGQATKASCHCEVCNRLFYHRSSLARHYAEAHPEFLALHPPFILPPPGSLIGPPPFALVPPPTAIFPNQSEAIAAAAAALQLGILPQPPNFPPFQAILPSFLPSIPSVAQTTSTFSKMAEGSSCAPIVLSDESSSHSPPKSSLKQKNDEKIPSSSENQTEQKSVECLFCGKIYPNRNPALIFHQIVAHKLTVDQFNSELSPPNFVNCPDCSLPLNGTDADFPNHACSGPKKRPSNCNTGEVGVNGMLCDKCGECLHNEDAYAAHREREHCLFDCQKCFTVLESQDGLAKHECQQVGPIISLNSPGKLIPCPLCSDLFTEKTVLAEHLTGYHRTEFALFDKNGPFCGVIPSSCKNSPQRRQQSSTGTASSTTIQSSPKSNSSPENVIPPPPVVKEGEHVQQPEIAEPAQSSSPQSPSKRRPLANRASAADKWRNVDGFNCAHCGATFLTSQSRAQHVRWRHPEIYLRMTNPEGKDHQPSQQGEPGVASGEGAAGDGQNHQQAPSTPVSSPSRTKTSETFVCPVCGSSYISARSRSQHIRWSHPDITLSDPNIVTSPSDAKHDEASNFLHKSPSSSSLDPKMSDETLLANLKTGYKGTCEVCGVSLANAQGRSQHLRYKHPEAWALLRSSGLNISGSSSNTSVNINNSGNNSVTPTISPTAANGLRISSSDVVLEGGGNSPDSGGENGGHYTCMFCDKVFTSKRGRGRHYYWTHQQRLKDYTGAFPADEFSRQALAAARLVGSGEGQGKEPALPPTSDSTRWFVCTRCPKRFLKRVGLSIHMAQAHRRQQETTENSGAKSMPEENPAPSSESPPRQTSPEKTPPKKASPSANARCLECESCFLSQAEVVRHLLEIHNVSEPTDAHWVWTVVHAEDDDEEGAGEDEETTQVDTEEDGDNLQDGDFVREIVVPMPATLACSMCQKSFPNELLFRGHMLLEHQVNYNGVSVQSSSTSLGAPVGSSSNSSGNNEIVEVRCADCRKMFTSTRALHIHEHHSQHGPHRSSKEAPAAPPVQKQTSTIPCINCQDQPVFGSPTELQAHQQRKHKPIRCSKCNVLIEGHDAFRVHRCEAAPNSRKRPAEVIDLVSKSDTGPVISLDDYLPVRETSSMAASLNGSEPTVVCSGCNRMFVSTRALHIHQRMAGCHSTGSSSQQQQQREVVVISPESDDLAEVYPCDCCSETFSRPQGLACHKRSKHNYVSMSPRSVASRHRNIASKSTSSLLANNSQPSSSATQLQPTLPPKIECKNCKTAFESRYDLIEHSNMTKSKCGASKSVLRRSYQSRVWGAIRQALVVKANIVKKRRELVDNWLKKIGAAKPEEQPPPKREEPPPPKEEPQANLAPENNEGGNRRPRRASTMKNKVPSPPRSPGKRTSPILPTKSSSSRTSSKNKAASPPVQTKAAKQAPETGSSQRKRSTSTAKQADGAKQVVGADPAPPAPVPAPAPPGVNRCSMCGREFPTPVQLMIHYCRDNCAGKSQPEPTVRQEVKPFVEPPRPSLPAVTALPNALPPPQSSSSSSSSTVVNNAGAESSTSSLPSSTAAGPRKAARMKRPTTFDSSEDGGGGDRPSPAFL